jgi:hypothetical protein
MAITRRILLAQLLLVGCGALPGCAWMRTMFGPRDPFAGNAPCALPPDASAAQIVAHLNANTSRIAALRSDDIKVTGRGAAHTPVPVNAALAVESPRNFRMTANSIAGEEVDLGSNQEEFWFWNRRSEPKHVFVNYHDEEPVATRRTIIPFQPEWIMEVFGVMPIDAGAIEVHPGPPGSHRIDLVADRTAPDGRQVRKVTTVDTCYGKILSHALYDESGQLIASARILNHWQDPKTHAILPRQVDLDWPQAQLGLTMSINRIEVNPPGLPDGLWRKPTKEGYPEYPPAR